MNINIKEYIKNNIIYLDGAMGSMLQRKGLTSTKEPERLNLTHPEVITSIHREYFEAGSNIVNTHTFGANALKYSTSDLESIIKAAINNAKRARDEYYESSQSNSSTIDSANKQASPENSATISPKWIALDIGPTGRMLAPFGDFDFEDAVAVFKQTIELGVKQGVDLIMIETMSDSYETKAALLAAKEICDLPVFVSNSYGEDGKLLTGASPAAMVALLEGMGADAIGVNCSFGPDMLTDTIEDYLKYASIPVILKPNAGLPYIKDGVTLYDVNETTYAEQMISLLDKGVRVVGGCCGTTPDYIKALVDKSQNYNCKPIIPLATTMVSSYTHAVTIGHKPILIGERINPTGKTLFKEALINSDINYVLNEGVKQQDAGVDILDVNVGLPQIDEVAMLQQVVTELQAIINLPLQIDTSNPAALEVALRRYNGKALINSVNGTKASMESVFPLAKKYGGVIIALTLDEKGIPVEAVKRYNIAKNILETAATYGIDKKNIVFDPLALAISTDSSAGIETLKAIEMITKKLGCKTSLGVSNVSFGLPYRDIINASFLTGALYNGLSAAIINPFSEDIMKAYHSFCTIKGLDENCSNYIEYAENLKAREDAKIELITMSQHNNTASNNTNASNNTSTDINNNNLYSSSIGKKENITQLQHDIIKGLKDDAASHTAMLLVDKEPLSIINEDIIPALDLVGKDFEAKRKYLPQLLMSAEAAKASFDQIKKMSDTSQTLKKCPFVIATVKGDVHDIGKNIVKLLLENYSYQVIDLGRDVAPETILDAVIKHKAPLVGLSALMTTTTPAMEETIKLLKSKVPECKIVVGGAVLTKEYADSIGADFYAKDALDTVKYSDSVYSKI